MGPWWLGQHELRGMTIVITDQSMGSLSFVSKPTREAG